MKNMIMPEYAVKLIMAAVLFLSPGSPLSAECSAELCSRLDSVLCFRNRLILDAGSFRLYGYIEENIDESPEGIPEFQLGCRVPFFLAGPVDTRGALKELFNPGGYSPGSEIYFELSGLKPRFEMNTVQLQGLSVHLPGEEAGISGMYHLGDRRFHGGAWTNISIGRPMILGGLFLTSLMDVKDDECGNDFGTADEPWIEEYRSGDPKICLHAAMNASLTLEPVRAALMSGISASITTLPGYFIRGAGFLDTVYFTARVSASYVSPDYLTPDGQFPARAFVFGARTEILPDRLFSFKGEYCKEVSRLSVFPAMLVPCKDTWEAAVCFTTGYVEAEAVWTYGRESDEFGGLYAGETFSGEIKIKPFPCFEAAGGFVYSRTSLPGEEEKKVPLELIIDTELLHIKASAEFIWEDHIRSEYSIRFDSGVFHFGTSRGSGFLKLEAEVPQEGIETVREFFDEHIFMEIGWSLSGTRS